MVLLVCFLAYIIVYKFVTYMWTTTWQNQQNECAPSEDSDQTGNAAQSDRSLLSAWRKLGSLATHWAHREDFDQTGRMPRLICVFAGCIAILLVLSCRGSYVIITTTAVYTFLRGRHLRTLYKFIGHLIHLNYVIRNPNLWHM